MTAKLPDLPPLPRTSRQATVFGPGGPALMDAYLSADMQAYARQYAELAIVVERERCAQIVETMTDGYSSMLRGFIPGDATANAIRGPAAQQSNRQDDWQSFSRELPNRRVAPGVEPGGPEVKRHE